MHQITVLRDKRGLGVPAAAGLIKRAVKCALKCEGIGQACLVNVLLTDDEGIREINLSQRGQDKPTDVLSFPQNELQPGQFDGKHCEFDYDTGRVMLGDMVMSVPRCLEQAEEYGHTPDREMSYLAVHSILHLLGYDHLDEGEQKKAMRRREDEIMAALGL